MGVRDGQVNIQKTDNACVVPTGDLRGDLPFCEHHSTKATSPLNPFSAHRGEGRKKNGREGWSELPGVEANPLTGMFNA